MRNFNRLLLVISVFATVAAKAYEPKEGKVSAILGPYATRTDFRESATGARAPWHDGMGLIVQGDASDHGALEIALFHMNKDYFRERSGKYLQERTELVQFTMGYRWWHTPVFSSSLSFYSTYSIGDRTVIQNDFLPTDTPDTSAGDITDYGFDLSVQAELWSEGRYAVVLDARYSPSVTPKPNEQMNHYGAFIGLKYMIQEKDPPKDSIPGKK